MAGLRFWVAVISAPTLALCACGKGGGGTASGQAAASGAPPAAASASAAPSDTAASSAAASALPPVAAAPPAATVAPASAAPAPPKREPTAAELLRTGAYEAKEQRLDALYENAKERDPTGEVEREQASALAQRRACADKRCLDAWFSRREAALRRYVEN